jgi:hypothetical protein
MKLNIIKIVVFMISVIIGFALGSVFIGCDSGKSPSKIKEPVELQEEKPVRIIYGGLVEGCKAMYNPRFCPEKYNPKNLNAGEEDNVTAYLKDKNGNIIQLDKTDSDKVLKALKGE